MTRFATALAALALLLAGCAGEPEPATPALWEVTGPAGEHGYLFGTIHSLDEDVAWRSSEFARAFAACDTLVVEAATLGDRDGFQRAWNALALTPGQPPLSQRVPPGEAEAVHAALTQAGLGDGDFADVESWAAAITLANALREEDGEGIDRALLGEAAGKRVVELEGVAGQLAIFDRLPQSEQVDLLVAVARTPRDDPDGEARVARLWRTGDMEAIAGETHKGMLADPELREALLAARNRAWADRVAEMLARKATPFVAVGAAHMAGPDGLPALLAARGYTVERIQ